MSNEEMGQTSPAEEVRAAVTGFVTDFKGFQAEIETKLKQTEERMTMLDRKMTVPARTPLAGAADHAAPYQKAFNTYLRNGDEDGLRGMELEGKALSTAVNSDGGYLVDPQTSASVQSVLNSTASIRAVASVVQVEATSYDVLIDHAEMEHGWASEAGSLSETTTGSIDRISIGLHELSALPKASQRLLDDSAFDIEAWLAGRIADKFARAEAAAFINGDGIDKPTGFLTHPKVDNDVWAWGNIGYVPSGTNGEVTPDTIIDLVYAVGAQYRANGTFVMNSKVAGMVRKLTDGDGRFLWSDGLASGQPAMLLGYRFWLQKTCRMRRRIAIPLRLVISAQATLWRSVRICAFCAIRSAPSHMCCSMRPSALVVMSATLLRSSC